MTDKEKVDALIKYLHALTVLSNDTGVKVFAEIHRTVAELERLLK